MLYTKYGFGALGLAVRVSDALSAPVFNTGIAFQLPASDRGVALTHLHVGPTLIKDAAAVGIGTRLLVVEGNVPDDMEPFQQNFEPTALDIFPIESSEGERFPVLYAAMYNQSLDAAGVRTANRPDHCDFDDRKCPRIASAGNLSVLLFPMFSAAMIAAMTANMFVYLQMNAWGWTGEVESLVTRSLPPARVNPA